MREAVPIERNGSLYSPEAKQDKYSSTMCDAKVNFLWTAKKRREYVVLCCIYAQVIPLITYAITFTSVNNSNNVREWQRKAFVVFPFFRIIMRNFQHNPFNPHKDTKIKIKIKNRTKYPSIICKVT